MDLELVVGLGVESRGASLVAEAMSYQACRGLCRPATHELQTSKWGYQRCLSFTSKPHPPYPLKVLADSMRTKVLQCLWSSFAKTCLSGKLSNRRLTSTYLTTDQNAEKVSTCRRHARELSTNLANILFDRMQQHTPETYPSTHRIFTSTYLLLRHTSSLLLIPRLSPPQALREPRIVVESCPFKSVLLTFRAFSKHTIYPHIYPSVHYAHP